MTSKTYQRKNLIYRPAPVAPIKKTAHIAHDEAFSKPIANVFFNFSNN